MTPWRTILAAAISVPALMLLALLIQPTGDLPAPRDPIVLTPATADPTGTPEKPPKSKPPRSKKPDPGATPSHTSSSTVPEIRPTPREVDDDDDDDWDDDDRDDDDRDDDDRDDD
ncbi:MAG: hypothetical protein V9G04_09380 [Nocardioides sp.]|jgi:hypothetical protein